ncbi:hypothetical protein B0I08_101330 [Glaciihabitans tibetensis]|uniref:Uncharacterized protein n=1 Tax=Glaciihabitans tibetensis TaxID=1266600 RepID=A0A2T0VJ05_9MICO|nr:hypothetical protein [Glaciihabitans tibetensis]PRY70202.1 hypothetical protein B0I08_101330 [Glaciihabitans tibetensis]
MTDLIIEGGALFATVKDRTVRGVLMPWGQASRQSLTTAPITFPRGTLKAPRDVSIVSANIEHDRFTPVARATSIEDTEAGLVAEFSVADTDEGDELLASIASGKLSKLSAEVKGIVRDGLFAVSAILTGAAFTSAGAFEGAGLFALAPDPDAPEAPAADENAPLAPDADGDIAISATEIPATVTITADGSEPTIFTPPLPPEGEALMGAALVPGTTLEAPAAPAGTSLREVAQALALFANNDDRSGLQSLEARPDKDTALFALNDVKITTAGSVGATAGIPQPQWLGELWSGRTFERRVIPLLSQAALTSFTIKGFRWLVKPTMAAWAGDGAAVPTNTPTTEAYTATAVRYAGGHAVSREFRDFTVEGFWEAYFAAMTDSYASLTDSAALAALVAGATTVTAGAVPAGANSGLVSIIDGAMAVIPTAVPSFAIAAPDVYRSILLGKEIDRLAFLNTSLGLEAGTIDNFRVIPHAGVAAGKVLVGTSAAATSYELPGAAPIRTEALDQIRGQLDEALFGYAAVTINKASGLALVSPAV